MSETPRDGNWLDKWGACKVCGGEIPYGHANNCDIYKLEHQLNAAKEKLQVHEMTEECSQCKHPWNPSLVESGWCIFCILKERTKERDEWKACAEEMNAALISARNELEVFGPADEDTIYDKAITTFNQLKEKSKCS